MSETDSDGGWSIAWSTASDDEEWLRTPPERLTSSEKRWRDKQPFLEAKGYMLGQRYFLSWTPSWGSKMPARYNDRPDDAHVLTVRCPC